VEQSEDLAEELRQRDCTPTASVRLLPVPPEVVRAGANDVNERGEIAGGVTIVSAGEEFIVGAIWDKHDRLSLLPRVEVHSALATIGKHGGAAGGALNEIGSTNGFSWSEKRGVVLFETLARPGGSYTDTVRSMNKRGEVVGRAELGDDLGPPVAALWSAEDGALEVLGTLGGDASEAMDVNDAGVIVGGSGLPGPSGDQRAGAFRWTREDGMSVLELPADVVDAEAVAINERDEILVLVARETAPMSFGILRRDSSFDELPIPPGYVEIRANAMNDAGWVVGSARLPNGNSDNFVWNSELEPSLLPRHPETSDGIPTSINNRGTAVGSSNSGVAIVWTLRCRP
jgi:uncharacterized membrane protein